MNATSIFIETVGVILSTTSDANVLFLGRNIPESQWQIEISLITISIFAGLPLAWLSTYNPLFHSNEPPRLFSMLIKGYLGWAILVVVNIGLLQITTGTCDRQPIVRMLLLSFLSGAIGIWCKFRRQKTA